MALWGARNRIEEGKQENFYWIWQIVKPEIFNTKNIILLLGK